MRVVGRSGWALALPVALGMFAAAPALAQPDVVEPGQAAPPGGGKTSPVTPAVLPAATPSDTLSPLRLMDGPSLRETGRIAIAPAPAPMNLIESQDALNSPKEKSIARAASTLDAAPAGPAGFIDPRVLDREIAQQFTQVADCRVEVARAKQVMPPQIVADTLLLRWIIERDGTTGPTDVVATAPADLAVMDCAKRVMSQWRFTPPRGGQKAIERPFTFTGNIPAAAREPGAR